MTDLVFPQPGDLPDAAYFAFQSGRGVSGIVSGLILFPDYTEPAVTVGGGKAVVNRGSMTTDHPNITPVETVRDAVAVAEIDETTVDLDINAVNHLFFDAAVDTDDSPAIIVKATDDKPTTASFKIGEVDTQSNTAREQWNLISDSGTLTYPDEQAIDSEDGQNRLSSGTLVFDRTASRLFVIE